MSEKISLSASESLFSKNKKMALKFLKMHFKARIYWCLLVPYAKATLLIAWPAFVITIYCHFVLIQLLPLNDGAVIGSVILMVGWPIFLKWRRPKLFKEAEKEGRRRVHEIKSATLAEIKQGKGQIEQRRTEIFRLGTEKMKIVNPKNREIGLEILSSYAGSLPKFEAVSGLGQRAALPARVYVLGTEKGFWVGLQLHNVLGWNEKYVNIHFNDKVVIVDNPYYLPGELLDAAELNFICQSIGQGFNKKIFIRLPDKEHALCGEVTYLFDVLAGGKKIIESLKGQYCPKQNQMTVTISGRGLGNVRFNEKPILRYQYAKNVKVELPEPVMQ